MTHDNQNSMADAFIHAMDKIDEKSQDQELKELQERVKDLEQRNEELESYIRQLAARRVEEESEELDLEDLEGTELDTEEEETQETEETEGSEPYFKEIKPSNVSIDVRKNAIVEYLKELKEEEGKYASETVYEISESVFGHRPGSSSDKEYRSVYNAINEEPRISTGKDKEKRDTQRPVGTYKVNEKVKTH